MYFIECENGFFINSSFIVCVRLRQHEKFWSIEISLSSEKVVLYKRFNYKSENDVFSAKNKAKSELCRLIEILNAE